MVDVLLVVEALRAKKLVAVAFVNAELVPVRLVIHALVRVAPVAERFVVEALRMEGVI